MSNFTCQSKFFISIFFACQVSACELQPFSCHDLANDIYSQTAKTVFSHLNRQNADIQFTKDVYKSTKEVLKDFRCNQKNKLQHHLTSQGFFFSNVIKYSLSSVNSIWSESQSYLPKCIRYINNSLPTRKNMARWGLSQSPDCSFFCILMNFSFVMYYIFLHTDL